eukprot:TRINITY_DN2480_c0_g2_i1.p1 TRINITY_DN2480_c0_g2~~TRINITY_DN2480_c0_g2_i1.p1  ORF type:complete len:624 (+),score=176.98 TRINITY_DN2480_c0_g2_i1:72-1943(+)
MAVVQSAYAKQAYHPLAGVPGVVLPQQLSEPEDDRIKSAPEVLEAERSPWEVLGLLPGSAAEECVRAYKRLSMRWHPDRHPGNIEQAEKRFKAINEAYHTLVEPGPPPTLKAQPDFKPPPVHPYYLTEGMHKSVQRMQVHVTLEELFRGVMRRKVIKRGRCRMGDMEYEKKIAEVQVHPGWHHGTQLVYRNEGDQSSGGQIADLVIEVQQDPHVYYRRAGDDIEHQHTLTGDTTPLRLPSLEGREVGVPSGPLVAYANIFSEQAGVAVTLLPPQPLPPEAAALLPPGKSAPESSPGKDVWARPAVKSLKLRDKEATAFRERLPGPNQVVKGAKTLSGRGGTLSISWKISRATEELVVGLGPPEAQIDRRFSEESSRKWGLVWGCDGSVYNLGTGMVKAQATPYGPGDVLQMSVHLGEQMVWLLKNGKLVYHAGQRIVVPVEGYKAGDVHTVEGAGMPIVREQRDMFTRVSCGYEVIGRGDLLVYFKAPKSEADRQQERDAEGGAWGRLLDWLSARKHPPPRVKDTESGSGAAAVHQVKLTLVQTRPFPTEGAFNDLAVMGKQLGCADAARDSAAAKALRILEGLARRHPELHREKRKRDQTAGGEGAAKRACAESSAALGGAP